MNIISIKQKLFYGVNAKIWLTLVLVTAISSLLVIPYSVKISGQSIPALSEFLKTFLIVFIQFGIFIYLGLRISKKIEIEPTPVLSGKTKIKSALKISIILGVIAGLSMLLLDLLFNSVFSYPLKEGVVLNEIIPGPLEGFLASFTGGITEEAQMRLFFVPFFSLIIIGVMRLFGFLKTWKHTDKVVWVAIILAAILFGVSHLPATATIMYITPVVILRAILLNGVGGVIFGWLFFRKGLEFAIIAHFSADIVLHVIFPLLNYAF